MFKSFSALPFAFFAFFILLHNNSYTVNSTCFSKNCKCETNVQAFFIVWAITAIINNITNIIANHLAIVYDAPEISPNPNNPESRATIKNIIAQPNQPDISVLLIFDTSIIIVYPLLLNNIVEVLILSV